VFGQVAAKADTLYIAIITDADMTEGDDALRGTISAGEKDLETMVPGRQGQARITRRFYFAEAYTTLRLTTH